jgi:hypothetical protein
VFMFYMFERLLVDSELSGKNIVFAAFNRTLSLKKFYEFDKDSLKFIKCEKFEDDLPNTFYFLDGPPSSTVSGVDSLGAVFCSPNKEYKRRADKNLVKFLYMPVWTFEEIQDATGDQLDEPELRKRFNLFGGSVRQIFNPKDDNLEWLNEKIEEIKSLGELQDYLKASVPTNQVSHHILYYDPKYAYNEELGCELPTTFFKHLGSQAIVVKLLKRFSSVAKKERISLINCFRGVHGLEGAHGWLLEDHFHHLVLESAFRGLELELELLANNHQAEANSGDMEIDKNNSVERLKLVNSQKLFFSRDMLKGIENLFENVYFFPEAINFESVDSFYRQGDNLYLFQCTRSPVHSINAAGVLFLLKDCQKDSKLFDAVLTGRIKLKLVFVVINGSQLNTRQEVIKLKIPAVDDLEKTDLLQINGIGQAKKEQLTRLGIQNAKDLYDKFKSNKDEIRFVKEKTKQFVEAVDSHENLTRLETILGKMPQYRTVLSVELTPDNVEGGSLSDKLDKMITFLKSLFM